MSNGRRQNDPKLIDPVLLSLMIGSGVVGLVGLVLVIAIGNGWLGSPRPQTATNPAAVPTETAAVVEPTAEPVAEPAAPASAPAGVPTEPLGPALASGSGEPLEIGSDGDLLAFDNLALEAPANSLVTLTFNNNAAAVQHNWVLIDSDDDTIAAAVNDAAQANVAQTRNAASAVPLADTPSLLVATHMINAGDSVEVTFETPDAGTYLFICTFPGHYLAGMVGELIVE